LGWDGFETSGVDERIMGRVVETNGIAFEVEGFALGIVVEVGVSVS